MNATPTPATRVKGHTLTALLIAACLVLPCSAQPLGPDNLVGWPIAEDIPKPTAPNPGLAGDKPYGILRYLLARGPSSLALSNDGKKLAFLASDTGQPQLYTLTLGDPTPQQLTFGRAVQSFHWLPDSAHLLYASDRDGNEREAFTLVSTNGSQEQQLRGADDTFVVFGSFSDDGERFAYASTERNGTDFDIFVQDLKSGSRKEVLRGHYGFFADGFRPDQAELLVSETRGEDGNNLYLVNTKTGESQTLFKPEVSSAYDNTVWRAEGEGFYLATDHEREFKALAYYDLASASLKWLATPEHPVGNVTLFDSGRKLAWTENVDGYDQLRVMNIEKGGAIDVPQFPAGVIRLSGAHDANLLGIQINGPTTAGEVWTWQPGAPPRRQVAATMAGLLPDDLAVPRTVRFKARDDVTLYGLFYEAKRVNGANPADNGPPPTLIRVHGGPTGQARPRFDPTLQYLVGRGYAVLDLNFRGSTGYGKTFARLDNGRLRPNAVLDIKDAITWLAENNVGDVQRLAIMGGSYGGYLTNAAVASFPDAFKAAVSFVGVSDWVRALEEASPALKASDRIEYGDINDPADREFFASISPINMAHQVRTPMVVVHGANDPRDPVTESDRFVTAVRQQEVEVKYLRFADEGHSLRKTGNRITAYQLIADFLDEKMGTTP